MSYLIGRIILFFFAVLGSVFSGLLIWYHNNPTVKSSMVSSICGGDKNTGCSVINQSNLSEFLNLPMALWGYFFYMIIIALLLYSLLGNKEERNKNQIFIFSSIFYLSIFGILFDFFLGLYSIVVLKTICNLCAITYLASLGLMITIILWGIKMDKSIFNIRNVFRLFKSVKPVLLVQLFLMIGILSLSGWMIHSQTSGLHESPKENSSDLKKAIQDLAQKFKNQKEIRLSMDNRPFIGDSNAKMTIIEFIDPLCPHCRNTTQWLKSYQKKHSDDIKIYQLFYPLDSECNKNMGRQMHPGACFLSYAQYCSGEQDKFWVFNQWMFQKLEHWYKAGVSEDYVYNSMNSIGINTKSLQDCIHSKKYHKRVLQDISYGEKFDLTGTPTIIANGKRLPPLKFIYLEMMLDILIKE